MTFYEAALQVLEGAGHPLHFQEITERSIAESLLSHVGKTPEQTMLSRLAAMAKRKGDRRVIVTAKDTFALSEWQVPEDPEALALTGVVEPHPEEGLPPLRPVERHPETRREYARSAGRGTDRKRRRDEDEERGSKRKRYPPVPEVAFDLLSEAHASMSPEALLEQARELGYASKELTVESLLTSLLEDNQKRIDAGRRPQFVYGADGFVGLERAGTPSEAPSLELQAAFAAALGIPLEGGRPVFAKAAPAEGKDAEPKGEGEEGPLVAARAAIKEARKLIARVFRQKLQALEAGTFERATFKLLHGHDFRELKVAKRSKDGPLITARRREGSVELRFAIRLHRSGAVDRRLVQELRRDLGHYNAQVGLVLSAGDLRGDARSEAQASGALVMLWCGEALAEKFLESHTGVKVQQLEVYEPDEAFFAQMAVEAEEARARREDRQREREGRPSREDRRENGDVADKAESKAASRSEEGDADLDAATEFVAGSAAGAAEETAEEGDERRRRRRRRRGRRGRGPKEEGEAQAAEGAEGADAEGAEDAAAEDAPASDEAAVAAAAGGEGESAAVEASASDEAVAGEAQAAAGEAPAQAVAETPVETASEEVAEVSEEDIEEVTDVGQALTSSAATAVEEASEVAAAAAAESGDSAEAERAKVSDDDASKDG